MKVLLSVLTGIIVTISCAGQSNSLGHSDPDAKLILDKASAKIKSYKAVQAAFTLELQDEQGNSQGIKKGKILYRV